MHVMHVEKNVSVAARVMLCLKSPFGFIVYSSGSVGYHGCITVSCAMVE